MTKLLLLAKSKGWDENAEFIKFAIPREQTLTVNDKGQMMPDVKQEERIEVGYYVMRQIERWLMNKHNIYISFRGEKMNGKRRFCYFISLDGDRKPLLNFPDEDSPDSIDKALFEALNCILKLLPNL